ncbi:FMN reductase [Kribbia dieselivorans]|uniref:FMN reductase n=1 Tax=Kribbia dieselivorans TaxID=331526 RepID=UPI000838FF3B|nr:FMN reductase [Kribbia dieselivorans]
MTTTERRTRTLVVVSAGLSNPSSTRKLADLLTDATTAELRGLGSDVIVEVIELRDLAQEMTSHLLSGFPSEHLAEVLETVTHADGLIAVTPVFSASYSGLFKMFVDLIDEGKLAGTPTLIAATAGSARHSLVLDHALRPLFSYLKAIVVPTGVFAASDDWGTAGESDDSGESGLTGRVQRAGAELAQLVAAHTPAQRTSDFDVVDFESLLQG